MDCIEIGGGDGVWTIEVHGTVFDAWGKAESVYEEYNKIFSVTLYRYGNDGTRWSCYTIKPYRIGNPRWLEMGF